MRARTYCTNKLDFDACVLQALIVFWSDRNRAFHRFTICIEWGFFYPVLVKLHINRRSVIGIFQDDIDVYGSGEEVRHCERLVLGSV